jgi:hypothetical protein
MSLLFILFKKSNDSSYNLTKQCQAVSSTQKDSHLLDACRYVVLNPGRAKRVQRPEEWMWSSYGATAGRTKLHPCLVTDWVLSQFGSERKIAEVGYRRFVRDRIEIERRNAKKIDLILQF